MTDNMDWWETFFDDAYVEGWVEQGAFDTTAESAGQLVRMLDLAPGAKVLDIPCGFGRFSKPLHDAGHEVIGVDASRLAWSFDPDPEADAAFEAGSTDWATGVRATDVQIGDDTRQFRVRLYTATELVGAMTAVGFTDITAHGDLAGTPLDPSTRLVVRAVRPT